jgi:hypothetical protein
MSGANLTGIEGGREKEKRYTKVRREDKWDMLS